MKTRVFFPVAALLLAGCGVHVGSGASSYLYKQHVHNVTPAANIAQLSVANVSGPVAVDAWSKSEIEVDALAHSGDEDGLKRVSVEITPQGDQLQVKTHYARRGLFDFNQGGDASVDYTIHVPATVAVDVVNVSGNVSVRGIHNDVTVHDVSGDIDATGIAGPAGRGDDVRGGPGKIDVASGRSRRAARRSQRFGQSRDSQKHARAN